MAAGGPGASDARQIRIERGEAVIWSVEELVAPVADGRTLDDLGLQAGDRIILPQQAGGNSAIWWRAIQAVAYFALPVFLGVGVPINLTVPFILPLSISSFIATAAPRLPAPKILCPQP